MKAFNFKQFKEEQSQEEHIQEEVGMVYENLLALCHYTEDILELMDSGQLDTSNGIEAWVVEKIALSHENIQTVLDYLQYGPDLESDSEE